MRILLLIILAIGLLAACGKSSQSQPPVQSVASPARPSPTSAPLPPTATPTATVTASPPAPSPSATPTPSPAPAASSAANAGRVVLPQDDASHQAGVEWWYYNGHLQGSNGSRYGFHYVFFEVPSPFSQGYVHIGQLAVSDHQRGIFAFDQQFAAKSPEPEVGFRASADDWNMSGYDGEYELAASLEGYGLTLRLTATKPPVLHDGDGIVPMGSAGDSYYYTYPRLHAEGTLTDHSVETTVTGTAWMDHQWGDFQPTSVGWDWFSIQLQDDSEIMFFILRDLNGATIVEFGTYVGAGGQPKTLKPQDVTVHALRQWNSPTTDAHYPSGWDLEIETLGLSLRLTPLLSDSEVHFADLNLRTYWEGEVDVEGMRSGTPVRGQGFVELVGYVGSPATPTPAVIVPPTNTPVPTPSPTVPPALPTPSATPTPLPAKTPTHTPAPTMAPEPTATSTPSPTLTATPEPPQAQEVEAVDMASELTEVNDFLYQLQDIDLSAIGDSAYDLIVMDYSSDGSETGEFAPAQIAALKDSPGGAKIVLAYMSIGEAEDYRFYWRGIWKPGSPSWLEATNPNRPGNYKVRYWEPEWQSIIFPYTDRLLLAGFDGAYLDIIDAYEYFADQGRGTAAQEMGAFVTAIATYARASDPDFYIFPQNAPELAGLVPDYLDSVDGIGQEDIYYGYEDDDQQTPPDVTEELEGYLDMFESAGKLVLTVDYAETSSFVDDAYTRSRAKGYVPFVTVRDLDRLTVNPDHPPD